MQPISIVQYVLWMISPPFLAAIAIILYRRGYSAQFPWFTVYLLWVAFLQCFGMLIRFWSNPYLEFYGYWISQAVAILLSFLVLFEVFKNVLTSGTLPLSKSNFALINALLVIAAVVLASRLQAGETVKTMYTILVLSQTARFVQVGLMLILVVLSSFFGFYWSSQAFGIAAGFGFYASIELINSSVRALLGTTAHKFFIWTSVLSYQCATFVWLAYALKGRKSPAMELPEDKLPRL